MSSNLVERISTLTHTVRCTGLASFVTYQPLREGSLVFFAPQLGGTPVGTLPDQGCEPVDNEHPIRVN
jgi:hypothetical protein